MPREHIDAAEHEAGDETGELRTDIEQAERGAITTGRREHRHRRADHARRSAEDERQEDRHRRELRTGRHEPRRAEHDSPADKRERQHRPAAETGRQPADGERAGEGDQLDEEHQTDERRRIEMKLLEGDRGELADRRLHRTEDEHRAAEDAAEATEAGVPTKKGPREAEELAGRCRGVDA